MHRIHIDLFMSGLCIYACDQIEGYVQKYGTVVVYLKCSTSVFLCLPSFKAVSPAVFLAALMTAG